MAQGYFFIMDNSIQNPNRKSSYPQIGKKSRKKSNTEQTKGEPRKVIHRLSGKQKIFDIAHIKRFIQHEGKHHRNQFNTSIEEHIGANGSSIVGIRAF